RERAAHRAKGSRQIQGADPRHDTPDTGVRSATVDQRAEAIHRGMARLLRLLPDSASPHEPRSVDPSKIAFVSLAAVAKRAKPLQRTTPSRHIEVQCGGGGRLAHGPLANVRTPVGPTGAAQQLFRLARSPPNLCVRPSLTWSNRRGTDPYARWCGRGGAARHPPIPINQQFSSCSLAIPHSKHRQAARAVTMALQEIATACLADDREGDPRNVNRP